MKYLPQQRLKAPAHGLQRHRFPIPGGFSNIAFDPCIAPAGLPLHRQDWQGYHQMIAPWVAPADHGIGCM
jgi:hypothetical protein